MVVGKEELNDCVVVCRFWTPGVDFGAVGVAVLSVEGLEGSEVRFYLYLVVFQRLDLPSRATEDPARPDRSLELLFSVRRMRVGLTVLYKKV